LGGKFGKEPIKELLRIIKENGLLETFWEIGKRLPSSKLVLKGSDPQAILCTQLRIKCFPFQPLYFSLNVTQRRKVRQEKYLDLYCPFSMLFNPVTFNSENNKKIFGDPPFAFLAPWREEKCHAKPQSTQRRRESSDRWGF